MKRLLVALSILLVIIFLITGCGSNKVTTPATTSVAPATTSKAPATTTASAAQPIYGGTFTFIHNGGLPTLGGVQEIANAVGLRNTLPVFETLLRADSNGKLTPWLADSWNVSADGKTITFKLHAGIKFSDGTVFDAAAVKYNLEAALKANVRGSAVLKKVTSYEIVDPLTLKLNLSEFDVTLLDRLGATALGQMGSPTAMQKATTAENQAIDHMVGTGPFLFDSWQRDNFVKFKKNPNYWQAGKPYLDFVIFKNVADLTVAEMAYRAGEAQALENIDPVQAVQLAKDGFTVYSPKTSFLHQWLTDANNPDSIFKDKRLREALEYAVDKETMAKGIGMGYYEALYQPAMKSSPNYDASLIQRKYDPAKAKALLAEAGYSSGLKTTIISDVRVRKDTLVAFQTYLKAVGIDATLDIADVARGASLPMQGWKGILFPGFPVPNNLLSIAGRFGVATDYISFYRPTGWQEKWNAMVSTVDDTKRNALYKELLKTMNIEANVSFYQGDYPLQVLQKDILHGWELHSGGYSDLWYPDQVWLSKK